MLKGIPYAIMRHVRNHARGRHEPVPGPEANQGPCLSSLQDQSGHDSSDGGLPLSHHATGQGSLQGGWQPPELAVPQSLMLAVYPGE